ncbi:hypothetical protein ATANTOWER_025983, partial [Ataeniobius toweri]|nr:hypothetical protein [Ataeniobius toweri]
PEVIDGNTLTATVVDLNAWVEYEFRVLAKNGVGVGEPSPVLVKTRTEDAVPDAAPGDVGGGGGSRYELVITWETNTWWCIILKWNTLQLCKVNTSPGPSPGPPPGGMCLEQHLREGSWGHLTDARATSADSSQC